MKKTSLILMAILSTNLHASDDHETSGGSATTASSSSSVATATSASSSAATATQQVSATNAAAGGSASSTNTITTSVEQVPTVHAPNLSTTLTETCMGSTSAGAGWFGFGGTFGSTWSDDTCVRRLDARQMAALGEVAVARELMCQSDEVREAAKRAGKPCKRDE